MWCRSNDGSVYLFYPGRCIPNVLFLLECIQTTRVHLEQPVAVFSRRVCGCVLPGPGLQGLMQVQNYWGTFGVTLAS